MISTAEAVVIGAGSFGSSLAYHLAEQGLAGRRAARPLRGRRADLAARGRADPADPAGAGDDAAGQAERGEAGPLHRGDGHPAGVPPVGQRQDGARRRRGGAGRVGDPRRVRSWDSTSGPIDPDELAERAPWARTDGVQAMWITPSDLFLEPRQVPQVYTAAARAQGVTVLTETPVTGLQRESGERPGDRGDDEQGLDLGADRGRRRRRLDAAGGGGSGHPHPGRADAPPALHHRADAGHPQRAADLPRDRRQRLRAPLLGRADAGRLRGEPAAVRDARRLAAVPDRGHAARRAGAARAGRGGARPVPGSGGCAAADLPRRSADHDRRRQAHRRRGARARRASTPRPAASSAGSRSPPAWARCWPSSSSPARRTSRSISTPSSRFSPDFDEDELVEACVDAYAHHYSEDYAAIG